MLVLLSSILFLTELKYGLAENYIGQQLIEWNGVICISLSLSFTHTHTHTHTHIDTIKQQSVLDYAVKKIFDLFHNLLLP